jgi:hypothetical protein
MVSDRYQPEPLPEDIAQKIKAIVQRDEWGGYLGKRSSAS